MVFFFQGKVQKLTFSYIWISSLNYIVFLVDLLLLKVKTLSTLTTYPKIQCFFQGLSFG